MHFTVFSMMLLFAASSDKSKKEKDKMFIEKLKEDKKKLFDENSFFREKFKYMAKSNEDKLEKVKNLTKNNEQLSDIMGNAKKAWEKRFHELKEKDEDLMYQQEHAQKQKNEYKQEITMYLIGTLVVFAAILILNFIAFKSFGYKCKCTYCCKKKQNERFQRLPTRENVTQLL